MSMVQRNMSAILSGTLKVQRHNRENENLDLIIPFEMKNDPRKKMFRT